MENYRAYGHGQYGRHQNQCGMNSNHCHMNHNHNHMTATNSTDNMGCEDKNHHMTHMPIAMAYVPMQKWCELYDPKNALYHGTAFPELNLIFCGSRGKM